MCYLSSDATEVVITTLSVSWIATLEAITTKPTRRGF